MTDSDALRSSDRPGTLRGAQANLTGQPTPQAPSADHEHAGRRRLRAVESPAIRLKQISYAYESGDPVLVDVDLSLHRGEFVGIVGPSGCGKSTLLRIVAGLASPSSGEVVRHSNLDKRHSSVLSMVFQEDTLLPWLDVEKNVTLHARLGSRQMRRLAAERGRSGLDEILHMVGLADSKHLYPYQLSGGMRRRVAFLASIAANPYVMLLDEPFSAVDEPTRVSIHQDVFNVCRRMGTSVLLVTHDIAEAISLCDVVVVLSARPARVSRTYHLPFGDRRDMSTIRTDPRFLDYYSTLWQDLREMVQPDHPQTETDRPTPPDISGVK